MNLFLAGGGRLSASGVPLGMGLRRKGGKAAAMIAPYANGLAIDFRDGSMVIKDAVTPANNFIGNWLAKMPFTRASVAGFDDANGTYRSVAANTPRIVAGRGLLHEVAGTNLIPGGLTPSGWALDFSTLTPVAEGFGGFVNSAIVAATTATWNTVYKALGALAVSTTYSFRVRYKSGTSGRFRLRIRNVTGGVEAYILGPVGNIAPSGAPAAGTFSALVNTDLGNGIYEVSGIFTTNATAGTDWRFLVGPDSAVAGEDVILLAAQLEAGPATSFVEGTRSVDSIASILTSVLPMSQNAGTLFADVTTAVEDGANKVIVGFTDASPTNRALLRREIGGNLAGFVVQGGAFNGQPSKQMSADLTRYKIGFSWALNAVEFAVNGVSTAPDTSFTPPTAVTQFMIGRENGSQHFTGHIARVLWVPQALSAAQLQALTA